MSENEGIGRRGLFTAAGAAVVGGAAGWGIATLAGAGRPEPPDGGATDPPDGAELVEADRVAGITHPAVPQRHLLLTVIDVDRGPDALLAAVGRLDDPVAGDDAGEVTVTLGYSPEIAGVLWPSRAGADASLPGFAGDADGITRGGDVSVQVCAETAAAAADRTAEVVAALGGSVRWSAAGYRDAPTPQGTSRTSSGFVDGIINPRTAEELAAGVWIGEGRDTYVVYRRMAIDRAFLAQPHEAQERAIGRRRDTGEPLSGGGPMAEIDMFAKNDDGSLVIPNGAHARRAHPANIGRALMLRRSYTWQAPTGAGLLFTAFMNDPQVFVATQRRLDEQDDLIAHTTTDASGVFFVPAP